MESPWQIWELELDKQDMLFVQFSQSWTLSGAPHEFEEVIRNLQAHNHKGVPLSSVALGQNCHSQVYLRKILAPLGHEYDDFTPEAPCQSVGAEFWLQSNLMVFHGR